MQFSGAGDWPEQEYTVPGFADDLAWMCRELGVSRPVVVGHSGGGTIALELAARFRERCPQLVTGQAIGSGHFLQLEVPDQVNAMIRRFLTVASLGPTAPASTARRRASAQGAR